jgi:cytochrome c553
MENNLSQRKTMKYLLSLFVILSTVLFFGFNSIQTGDPEGKTIFVNNKCGTCHSVESAGLSTKAKKSTDLSDTGSKYEKELLTGYLLKKEKINNKNHPAAFKGTEEELVQLTNWLGSLKKEK